MNNEANKPVSRRQRPLYRDTDDKMIAGVSSGLAHYFDIDTTLVRVAFVVFTVFGGAGPLAYVVLWLVLKPAPVGYFKEDQTQPPGVPQELVEPEALPEGQPQTENLLDDVDELPSETPAEEPPITEP